MVKQVEKEAASDNYHSDSEEQNNYSHFIAAQGKHKPQAKQSKCLKKKQKPKRLSQDVGVEQKVKVGPPTSVWTRRRHKLFLMFFLQSLIQDPLKSYRFTHWLHGGTYQLIQSYINKYEQSHPDPDPKVNKLQSSKIQSDQVKSFAQRIKQKWKAQLKQKTLLVFVIQELYEEFVETDEDKAAIELMQRFEEFMSQETQMTRYIKNCLDRHDDKMARIDQLGREIKDLANGNTRSKCENFIQ